MCVKNVQLCCYRMLNDRFLNLNVIEMSNDSGQDQADTVFWKELVYKRIKQKREVKVPEGFLWMAYIEALEWMVIGLGNEDEISCRMIVIWQQFIPR